MDATNVDVAITGGAAQVPADFVPLTSKTPLPATAKKIGLINTDGIEITPASSSTSIDSWQLGPVRTVITDAYVDYTFTAIENVKAVRELYFGSTESAEGVIDWDPSKRVRGSFIFDAIDSADENDISSQRHWVPKGEVYEVQALTFNGTTPLSYGMTIRAFRGADGKCARIFNDVGDITEAPVEP
jgi:hypothetical protein